VQYTDLQVKDCNSRQPLLSVFSPASLIALQLLKSIETNAAQAAATMAQWSLLNCITAGEFK
jgi:hypothetical protein